MPTTKAWLPADIEMLRKIYPKHPTRFVTAVLNRSVLDIHDKARELGLTPQAPKLATPNTPTTLGKTYKATARQRGAGQPGPSPKPPGTVPPARIYLMHAPTYRPTPEPPHRPGADDHYRFRSLTATA